jgi:acyl-CoA thioesterase I
MNPIALYFASGDSLYPGAVLLLLLMAASPYLQHRWQFRLRNITVWFALAMIVMASPPFAWAIDAIFLTTLGLWYIASNQATPGQTWVRLRLAATAVLLVMLLWLPTAELSHRTMPVITGTPSDHLVIIGDSISAGIDSRMAAWPTVFQQITGVRVKNLSIPGAEATDALKMAEKVTTDDRVVLIEIGGNDLLTGVPSDDFGRTLDTLLSRVAAPGRTVVMFELPLLPNKIAYGQIQRQIATKYGI